MKYKLNQYLLAVILTIFAIGCATTQNELITAALNGKTDTVKALIAAGADVSTTNNAGRTPLMLASVRGHIDTVQVLLEAGADLDAKDREFGSTALMFAAAFGHTDIVRALLAAGADVNVKSNFGRTPLMIASMNGYTEIANELLAAGAIVNAKDNAGATALTLASNKDHTETANALLAAGAELDGNTEDVKVFSVHKQRTLDELGAFDFDRRFYIYETLDEIANKLKESPKSTIVKKMSIEEDGVVAILQLSDRDLDGQPDQFAFLPAEGGHTQDFGFLFDLNKDGRVDYLVFNGGPMFTKELEFYWMNYHWIDSNYDGRIDITVNNAVAPDASKSAQKGLTAWLYDSDFDGYTDKAEYIGVGIMKVVEEKKGTLTVNWLLEDISIDVGKDPAGEFQNLLLGHINAAIQ